MINIAFLGTFLGSRQKHGPIQTFADIVRIHYGATVVAQPQGGSVQEEDILETIKMIDNVDVAVICHVDKIRAVNVDAYDDAVKAIDAYLLKNKIKCVHLIFERDVPEDWKFSSGPVDYEIPKFNVFSKYRTQVSPEESDNCIGIPGNLYASQILITLIDGLL